MTNLQKLILLYYYQILHSIFLLTSFLSISTGYFFFLDLTDRRPHWSELMYLNVWANNANIIHKVFFTQKLRCLWSISTEIFSTALGLKVCVCVACNIANISKQVTSALECRSNLSQNFPFLKHFAFAISIKVIFSGCIQQVTFDSQKVSKLIVFILNTFVLKFLFH